MEKKRFCITKFSDQNVDLMMALDEKSDDHQSNYNSSWEEHECLNNIS